MFIAGNKGGEFFCDAVEPGKEGELCTAAGLCSIVYVRHFNNFSICTAEGKESTLKIYTLRTSRSWKTRKT
jgi:hypothetical protein